MSDLSNFHISNSYLDTGKVYLGKVNKKGNCYLDKKDITQEFIKVMLGYLKQFNNSLELKEGNRVINIDVKSFVNTPIVEENIK